MTADDWLPIETAPKDGTRVRLWCDGILIADEVHGSWSEANTGVYTWRYDNGMPINATATHWQPIVGPKLK